MHISYLLSPRLFVSTVLLSLLLIASWNHGTQAVEVREKEAIE